LFGTRAKRHLLTALLEDPHHAWTKADLARRAGVHTKGGVDEHLSALAQLGLVARRRDRRWIANIDHPLVGPLVPVLRILNAFPDEELRRSI
jgi:hypothetical protein